MNKLVCRLTGQWHMRWKPAGFHADLSPESPAIAWQGERIDARPWRQLAGISPRNAILCAAGPSLAELRGFRERQLAGDWIAGVNGAIRLRDREPVEFDLFVMTDPNMAHLQWDNLVEAFATSRRVIISPRVACEICKRDPDILKQASFWLVVQPHEPYGRRRPSLRQLQKLERKAEVIIGEEEWRFSSFSRNPHFGFFAGGTVTVAAIQALIFTGAKRIAIAGMDLSGGMHFYKEAEAKASRLKGDYETRIRPALVSAATVARTDGIELLNLSAVSRLPEDIIPKALPGAVGLNKVER